MIFIYWNVFGQFSFSFPEGFGVIEYIELIFDVQNHSRNVLKNFVEGNVVTFNFRCIFVNNLLFSHFFKVTDEGSTELVLL